MKKLIACFFAALFICFTGATAETTVTIIAPDEVNFPNAEIALAEK
jgi:hypothetical protein